MKVCAIIAAGGKGSRLGQKTKVLLKLNKKPLLWYSLLLLQKHPLINAIVIAAAGDEISAIKRLVKKSGFSKVISVVEGGYMRQDSVRNALEVIPEYCDLALVHDAARPFVTGEVISRVIKEAVKHKAAIAAVKVKPTIKRVDCFNEVCATLERGELVEAQTPQVFNKDLLLKAYQKATQAATDDSALVEKLGVKVKVVEGSYHNIKITTPEDLVFAKAILRSGLRVRVMKPGWFKGQG